jgi:hypothetical protein
MLFLASSSLLGFFLISLYSELILESDLLSELLIIGFSEKE